jgi:mannose-6-phosphate isomerase
MMSQIPSPEPRPYRLENHIQPYVWGSRGKGAFIPRFLGLVGEPDRPYAELWIGAHPKAPSDVLLGARVSLQDLIASYPMEILGEAVAERFSGRLPFLFKVLSAAEALSIQAHPNKEQAGALHAQDPEHYPDANHKPEVAVVLDSLTALVGFKSWSGMREALERYPEVASFVGGEVCDELQQARNPSHAEQGALVRRVFSTLIQRSITAERELLASINHLAERLVNSRDTLIKEEQLFLDLRRIYTGADVGLFAIFLLNLIHLEKGQGIFTHAGIPHAYLQGNIVECMANSDNVVRVGLTPKFKDAETLIEILDYEPKPISILGGNPDREEVIYQAPVSEFQVSRWRLGPGRARREATQNKPEVLLVTQGEVLISWGAGSGSGEEAFQRGQSVLIPALLEEFRVEAQSPAELFKVEVPL